MPDEPENWPKEGRVIFYEYSARYRPELDFALSNLKLEIAPGEKVIIYDIFLIYPIDWDCGKNRVREINPLFESSEDN